MKLYTGKIPTIAADIIKVFADAGDIEVSDVKEATLDIESVLKEYIRQDREITDRAKDELEKRKLPFDQLQKVRRSMAEERDFGIGDEAITWICSQVMETFMHSQHVDEVYADDATLRRKLREVLKRHMAVDEELDQEVRQRIKNLVEGTATWEIEYAKVMDQMKRKHGLQ